MESIKNSVAFGFSLLLWTSVTAGLLIFAFGLYTYFSIPSAEEIKGCLTATMNNVELCSKNNKYARFSSIPPHFFDALIASEDGNFYHHSGFDFFELQKSLELNLSKKQYARGGSTLSQQLAKNLFLTKEKTLYRKFREALITTRIESVLTKKEILEKYANVVEFGPKVFGIQSAARFYFDKSPFELLPEESAFLVMLLPNPNKNSRSFFDKKLTPYAFSKINILLNRLKMSKKLDEETYELAKMRTKFMFNSAFTEDWIFDSEVETNLEFETDSETEFDSTSNSDSEENSEL